MLNNFDIEYYEKEFAEYASKENGFGESLYCMSNERLADDLYNYFSSKYSNMKLWKTPQGQFISFGYKGETDLSGRIHRRISEMKNIIAEYEKTLEQLPKPIEIFE